MERERANQRKHQQDREHARARESKHPSKPTHRERASNPEGAASGRSREFPHTGNQPSRQRPCSRGVHALRPAWCITKFNSISAGNRTPAQTAAIVHITSEGQSHTPAQPEASTHAWAPEGQSTHAGHLVLLSGQSFSPTGKATGHRAFSFGQPRGTSSCISPAPTQYAPKRRFDRAACKRQSTRTRQNGRGFYILCFIQRSGQEAKAPYASDKTTICKAGWRRCGSANSASKEEILNGW